MNHTIILTKAELTALRNGIQKILHLAERSKNIAALLDITPLDVAALEDLRHKLPNPRHARAISNPKSHNKPQHPPAGARHTATQ